MVNPDFPDQCNKLRLSLFGPTGELPSQAVYAKYMPPPSVGIFPTREATNGEPAIDHDKSLSEP